MELIILLKLEGYVREAGLKNVSIGEMFDLIIGTSTGQRPRHARALTSTLICTSSDILQQVVSLL
jgi:hypothetical protein